MKGSSLKPQNLFFLVGGSSFFSTSFFSVSSTTFSLLLSHGKASTFSRRATKKPPVFCRCGNTRTHLFSCCCTSRSSVGKCSGLITVFCRFSGTSAQVEYKSPSLEVHCQLVKPGTYDRPSTLLLTFKKENWST